MNIWKLAPVKIWAARGIGALALASSMVVAQPAWADDSATISAVVPGAPETAWIAVQWQNADSTWSTVEGWQGDLDTTASGIPYKQWTVASEDYGKSAFRWVVYVEEGGSVWATSELFNLPTSSGENVEATLTGQTVAPSAPAASGELSAWTENVGFDAAGEVVARITMLLGQASPATYVGVQYLDANGIWQDVDGWQTSATINADGLAVVQWGVAASSFGQGPLRWMVYAERGGAVVGFSPTFDLPTDVGIDFVMHLSR